MDLGLDHQSSARVVALCPRFDGGTRTGSTSDDARVHPPGMSSLSFSSPSLTCTYLTPSLSVSCVVCRWYTLGQAIPFNSFDSSGQPGFATYLITLLVWCEIWPCSSSSSLLLLHLERPKMDAVSSLLRPDFHFAGLPLLYLFCSCCSSFLYFTCAYWLIHIDMILVEQIY